MPCLNPIVLKRKVTNQFSVEKHQYDKAVPKDHPLYIPELYISDEAKQEYYNANYYTIVCGCGKCIWCRRKRVNSWFIRSLCEMSTFEKNQHLYFITLTFNNDYVGDNNLQVSDVQKYIKRVRKNFGWKFKYIAVGEYGSKTGRRHYHLIFYGIPFLNKIDKIRLGECWKFGFSYIKLSDPNSIYYVLKYSFKQLQYDTSNEFYDAMELNRPFFLCSKGIGRDYYEKHKLDILKNGCIRYKGRSYSIPRYFRKLFVFNDMLIHNSYFLDNYDVIQSIKDDLRINYPVQPHDSIMNILNNDKVSLYKKVKSYICYIKKFVDDMHSLEVSRFFKSFNEKA